MPDISVVIPTFRRPVELAEAIDSVLAQEGVTVEIHVIDDCFKGSASWVSERYDRPEVHYHRNPNPSGGRPARVRNYGAQFASGDIVHFLDDDDIVPSGYYADALKAFQQNPEIGVVFGRIEPFGSGEIWAEQIYFDKAFARASRLQALGLSVAFAATMFFQPTLLVCSAAMIRRGCLLSLGGFDADPPVAEDVDFYARAIRRYGAYVVNRTSIRYRIGPSMMHQPNRQGVIAGSYVVMHARYRRERGAFDYYWMKFLARLLGALHVLH